MFLWKNCRLIHVVAPRKFDVLKANICPRSEASRKIILVLRTWLVRSIPERAARVRALAGDIIVLCFGARHFTLTMPLSTQVYKWVRSNCWEKPNKFRGSDLRWTSIPSRGVEILLAASCYRNRDKLRQL